MDIYKLEKMTPGERLRAFREQRGLTQEQLGRSVRIRANVISYFENGRRIIGAPSAMRLARYFQCDPFLFVENPEKILA